MKTSIKKHLLFMFAALQVVWGFTGCGNKDSGNSQPATTSYYISNGTCYNTSGVAVSAAFCSSTGYYMLNGTCYNSANQVVTSNYCTTSSYYMNNGTCYAQNGTPVAAVNCNNTVNGYYMNNGICYNSSNIQVSTSYCSNSTTGTTGTSCVGTYYSAYLGGYRTCNGSDCAGYVLVSTVNGQQVFCQ